MDIFRFNNPEHPTKMQSGQIINGIRSKTWIERYRDASEFTLTGYIKSGIREALPVDTLISHTNTDEIMIVENHEILEKEGQEKEVQITGRSFETFLENRAVGSNKSWNDGEYSITGYSFAASASWIQTMFLIQGYILDVYTVNDADAINFCEVLTSVTGDGTIEARIIPLGDLYSRVLDFLAIDNCGIKTIRPNPLSPVEDPANFAIVIHRGVDRSGSVIFPNVGGDYLESNRKLKNCAFVHGKWFNVLVDDVHAEGYARRMLDVDASDIDDVDTMPVGPQQAIFVEAMRSRGKQALTQQKKIELVTVGISNGIQKAVYRKDYDLGDLITVTGEYGTSTQMRVGEYVEIEDENGFVSYPTLTAP